MTLLYVVLALMGVAVLVTLLILLIKAIKAVNAVNTLLDDIKPDITETTEKLPELMEHATIITGNIVDVTDSIAVTVPAIMEKITPKKKPKPKQTKDAESVISSAVVNALLLLLTSRRGKKKDNRGTTVKVIHTISRIISLFTKR